MLFNNQTSSSFIPTELTSAEDWTSYFSDKQTKSIQKIWRIVQRNDILSSNLSLCIHPVFSAEDMGAISEVLDFSSASSATFGGGVAGHSGLDSWDEGSSGAGVLIFTTLGSSDGFETFGGTIMSSLFSISILLLVSVELLNVAWAELNGFGASLSKIKKNYWVKFIIVMNIS
jgi:hypothetical protein